MHRSLLSRVGAVVVMTALVLVGIGVAPATAGYEALCTGYDTCNLNGMPHAGYKEASGTSYWNMAPGHNCTNYVAYRLIRNGMATTKPWSGDGNAYNWGRLNPSRTNQTPAVGAVAWWDVNVPPALDAGHVAYIERVVSANEIIVSEDNWGGDFKWRRVTRSGPGWPSGFIHFNDVPQGAVPFGSVDSLTSPEPGVVHVSGWAADNDNKAASLVIHAYVGGEAGSPGAEGHDLGTGTITSRPDVDRAFPGLGNNHGYDASFTTALTGSQKVCVYAIGVGAGGNALLGCTTTTIENPNPFGSLDRVSGGHGTLALRGWAIDRSAASTPTAIHVYVGGPSGTAGAEFHAFTADARRDDVAAVHPWAGASHGFQPTFETAKRGSQQVCVYAINVGVGTNQLLGCATATIATPIPFVDVPVSATLYESIQWLAERGITTGYADGGFHPSAPVARDAMAAFLYRTAGSPSFTLPAVSPFVDVPTSHPFATHISWLLARGISTGWTTPAGTREFRPADSVSREAMAAFLYRAAGSPAFTPPATSPFTDVLTSHPFYAQIAWLAQRGISTGWVLPDGTKQFRPSEPVSREAMAAFLQRADGLIFPAR